jgi:prolipoprotein diacylglyceryl transferase
VDLTGLPLVARIPSPPISGFQIGPLRVTFYGILIAVGIALAWRLTRHRFEAKGGDGAQIDRILEWAVALGFLGARAAYVITHTGRFEGRWWGVLAIWEGGLAFFGGLTVGTVTALIIARRLGIGLGLLTNSAAPALPLAQAIGRWGNYFNQELFGTPTDLPWGLEIDPANRPAAYRDAATFHPTFLYESLWNVLLVVVVLQAERRIPSLRGRLLSVYLVGYGTGRFLLELLRTDTTYRLLGLSRNGWVSLAVVVVGLFWATRPNPRASHQESPIGVES